MTLKRLAFCVASVLLVLSWAVSASAATKRYSLLTGSGVQFHIGNGLALPVQTAIPACLVPPCTAFPPLLVGTTGGGHHTIIGTTSLAVGQKITVPPTVFSHPAAQATVGVFFSNPALYAVATNLRFRWPVAPAVFSVSGGPRPSGSASTVLSGTAVGNKLRYSPRVAGKRFGGSGTFRLQPGSTAITSGVSPAAVSIFGLTPSPPSIPPCTHVALVPPFPGPGGAGCIAILINAFPTGSGVIGGTGVSSTLMTPGTPKALPGVFIGRFGPNPGPKSMQPLGTVSFLAPAGPIPAPITAMATSTGFPWTTAMLTISATLAVPPEKFILSGADSRSAGGAGLLQMVSGSVSKRVTVGNNANRGWLRLNLREVDNIPTMSARGLAATAALMLLAGGYAARKRLFA
jgi:hypothetical protein